MTEAIKIRNLFIQIRRKEILHDISLTIGKGEIYGLIGPSGAGKTTLIKAIVGMKQATSGAVNVLGTPMPKLAPLAKIGYMAQSDALYNDLTGYENLEFFACLNGLKGSYKKERIQYVAKLVNLTADLKKKVNAFSGGMKRRLSLATALLADPELLILDEPTVGIDPELRQSIWYELTELASLGKTILVTTHVMDEAEKCDQLAMVREGSVIAFGTPQELVSQTTTGKLEDAFLIFGKEGKE